MNTISSNNSLLTWKHTNGYGKHGANLHGVVDELFLKDDYLAVFKKLLEFASYEGAKMEFIKEWHQACDEGCAAVNDKVKKISDANAAEIIVAKFRGNLGEIIAEKVFEALGSMWDAAPGSYRSVDPENEMFIDAQAIHIADGLPLGVQIKNYSVHPGKANAVDWQVFVKSMAMTAYWLQETALVNSEQYAQFLSIPRQMIFSFTPVSYDIISDNYKHAVKFIGPDAIEKLGLKHKPYIFKQIADEIERFSLN